jgi:hypothetical protein
MLRRIIDRIAKVAGSLFTPLNVVLGNTGRTIFAAKGNSYATKMGRATHYPV